MGVVNYDTVDGVVLGDSVHGTYMRDALGSVTGTIPGKVVADTYRYKPYGERLAKTGTAPDPRFQWNGSHGYRQTSISHSASYVRRRHLGLEEGRWTTVDPLWPDEPSFGYARGNTTSWIDRTGSWAQFPISTPVSTSTCRVPKMRAPRTTGRFSVSGARATSIVSGGMVTFDLVFSCAEAEYYRQLEEQINRQFEEAARADDCIEWNKDYHKFCDHPRSCNNMQLPRDCEALRCALNDGIACAQLRATLIKNCDMNPPPGWSPKPCAHAYEACNVARVACSCASKARGICKDIWLPTKRECQSVARLCNISRQSCLTERPDWKIWVY